MKKTWFSALVLASTMTLAATAQARGGGSGVLFDVNLFYSSTKIDDKDTGGTTTHQTDSKTTLYDLKLGMITGDGLYFGGLYSSRSDSVLNLSGTSGSALGASLGYFGSSGFFIMGHYLVSASRGDYKEGSGLQADVGYKAGVGGDWMVGGELSYRSISYKKNASVPSLDYRQIDEVVPMVSIGYLF